jgi:RNA methyltransferase, TrmH family
MIDLTNAHKKRVTQLRLPKFRQKYDLFVVEGIKIVTELCQEMPQAIEQLIATPEWCANNAAALRHLSPQSVAMATEADLQALTTLTTAPPVLAVVRRFNGAQTAPDLAARVQRGVSLVLATVQDPGNMGTILRVADWFGVAAVFCSPDCADIYNPKVVQATMGSLWRVPIIVAEPTAVFAAYPTVAVCGAVLGGDNLYTATLPTPAFLVMGNESKGLPPELQQLLQQKLTIPRIGAAESLNVGVATGILLSHWRG